MVEYCLSQNIITQSDIKYVILSSLTIDKHKYNSFISKCLKELPYDLAKLAINSMIGTFKPSTKKSTNNQSIVITPSSGEAYFYYLENQASFIDQFEVNKKTTFYHVLKHQSTMKMETESPLYEQIVQQEAIELHKLSKLIESKGGQVLDLSTDKIICNFPNNKFPFQFVNNNSINIKDYYYDEKRQFPKYKLEKRHDRLTFSKMENHIRKDIYKYENKTWTSFNDVEDNNFEPLAKQIIESNQSINIDGPAGTGKSYLVKEIQRQLTELGIDYKTVAPTNKACTIVQGTTLHRFVSMMRKKSNILSMKASYIIVEEISMVKEIFYKFLIMIKTLRPDIKFIIVGDFRQLAPVADRIEKCNYKNSPALFELSQGNRLSLTKCRRSDDELFNMLKIENINNLKASDFGDKFTGKHLSFTHKTRISVNKIMMEKMKAQIQNENRGKKKSIDSNYIELNKMKNDPHSQDVILFKGMPIISKVNNKEMDIINNETFTITDIKNNNISFKNDEKLFTIASKDFQKMFRPAYCITIHCSQGETYNEEYTIHDWKKLDRKLKYVALSRASNKTFINVIE
jgi:hypothetical protein